MFQVRLWDLFYGFIHNYWTFGIRFESKNSKWTQKILGYYSKLGNMLGFYTEFEWRRYDLAWFYTREDRIKGTPTLHIEHENASTRLTNLYDKIKNTKAPFAIGIGYPATKKSWNSYVKRIETLHRNLSAEKEIMFILDPAYFEGEGEEIVGYVARPRRKSLIELTATRYKAPDGTYYATWRDDREKEEEDEKSE